MNPRELRERIYAPRGVRKDGSRFYAHVTITALRDAGGRLWGFAKVTQDVTERRRAEQQLRDSLEREQAASQLHGGRAWVQDRPGGGASFRIHLPDLG